MIGLMKKVCLAILMVEVIECHFVSIKEILFKICIPENDTRGFFCAFSSQTNVTPVFRCVKHTNFNQL